MRAKEPQNGNILNDYQLNNLREHVYKSSGNTFLDPYMQVYWRWLVEYVPLWISPNMITLIGLIINIGTTVLLMYHCPGGHSTAPSSVYLACGVGLFIYQSLDAIDGKHARRTGTNSPLGEIFDHGCDAFSTVFVIIAYGITTDLGPSLGFFWLCCCSNFLFYSAHWQTLVSGVLHFGKMDVTEAQMFLIGVQIWTGLFGPGIWNIELFSGVAIKHAMLLWSTIASFVSFSVSGNAAVILSGGCGKNGATIADTSVLSPGIPVLVISYMFYKVLSETTSGLFENNTVLFMMVTGLTFTKLTNELVIAHMTKSPPVLMIDSIMLGPAALIINQFFNSYIPETFLLWAVFLFVLYDSVKYCVDICREICAGLGIPCLSMPKKIMVDVASSSSAQSSDSARARKKIH